MNLWMNFVMTHTYIYDDTHLEWSMWHWEALMNCFNSNSQADRAFEARQPKFYLPVDWGTCNGTYNNFFSLCKYLIPLDCVVSSQEIEMCEDKMWNHCIVCSGWCYIQVYQAASWHGDIVCCRSGTGDPDAVQRSIPQRGVGQSPGILHSLLAQTTLIAYCQICYILSCLLLYLFISMLETTVLYNCCWNIYFLLEFACFVLCVCLCVRRGDLKKYSSLVSFGWTLL